MFHLHAWEFEREVEHTLTDLIKKLKPTVTAKYTTARKIELTAASGDPVKEFQSATLLEDQHERLDTKRPSKSKPEKAQPSKQKNWIKKNLSAVKNVVRAARASGRSSRAKQKDRGSTGGKQR